MMKTKIKILGIALLLFTTSQIISAEEAVDVIHLKNGEVIECHIMSINNQMIFIQMLDGTMTGYSLSDVDSSARKMSDNDTNANINNETKKNKKDLQGVHWFFEASYTDGIEPLYCYYDGDDYFDCHSDTYKDSWWFRYCYSISFILGYQFGPHFFLGAGVYANDVLNFGATSYKPMPIFLDVRYNVLNRRLTPVIEIRGGCSVTEYSNWYAESNVGCRVGFGEKKVVGLTVMGGFTSQKFNDWGKYGDWTYGLKYSLVFDW